MKTRPFQPIVIAFLLLSIPALADRLELSNGTVEEGELLGIDNAIVMFRTEEGVQAYPLSEVTGLSFQKVSSSSVAEEASPKSTAPKEAALTIPSGTRLVVRTLDTVDSSKHKAGHRFRGTLEGAITVNGVTVMPRGAAVQGRLYRLARAVVQPAALNWL